MATMANPPPRDVPAPLFGKDYSVVRSPEYNYNPNPPPIATRTDSNISTTTNTTTTSAVTTPTTATTIDSIYQNMPKSPLHVSPPRIAARPDLADRCRQPFHNQIRPMKSPLYVPAVLRPTEKPARSSPPKRIEEEARPGDDSWGAIVGAEEIASGAGAVASVAATGVSSPIARTGVVSVTPDELEGASGPVTGLPSTNHWKPDSAALACNARSCGNRFGFFVRRHHCRRCGNIFCWQHSSNQAPLNQHALFHARGIPSRVCDRCYRCYNDWEFRRSSRSSSQSSSGAGTAVSSPMHIRANSVSSAPCGLEQVDQSQHLGEPSAQEQEAFRPKSFVASIPNHWNWSTF